MNQRDKKVTALVVALVVVVVSGLLYAFSLGPNDHTASSASQQTEPQTTGSR